MLRVCLLILAACLSACGPATTTVDDLAIRTVTLPNGRKIRAEAKIRPVDLQMGMMYRDSLEPGNGMLFIHSKPGVYTYWMYNTRIPLDIIWMDRDRRVVEISANTPPCKTEASKCPYYGGHAQAQYVLELGAGEAARNGVGQGSVLAF